MVLQKSRNTHIFVIPAKAGSQGIQTVAIPWTPVFTGVTTFCVIVTIGFVDTGGSDRNSGYGSLAD